MKVQFRLFTSMAALAIACMTSACTEQDEEIGDFAQLTTDDGLEITFGRMTDGGIAVAEVGPASSPSRLTYFASQHATPLEVFLAVAPGQEAPLALEVHHASMTDEPPRALAEGFRSFSGAVEPDAGDCSYASDHDDWFVDTSSALSWTDLYYLSGWYTFHVTPSETTQHLITHVCNVSESNGSYPLFLKVIHSSTVQYYIDDIDIGDRGIIYVLNDNRTWTSEAVNENYPSGSQTNFMRHGMMSP